MPVGFFPDVETHCCGLVTPGHTSGQREVHTCSRGGSVSPRFFFLEVAAQESSSFECDVPTERSPINSGQEWLGSQVGSVPFGSE